MRTGLRPSARVTLYDTPNAPLNVRAEPGHETVTLRWDDPNNPGIAGWQYRKRRPETKWEDWAAAGTGATTTESPVPHLTNGLKYLLQVRAYNGRGYGAASATVEAVPSGLRATAYNGAVGLDWVDPEIADLSGWRSRHRPVPISGGPLGGLPSGLLAFGRHRASASFDILAQRDADVEDETMGLSFGTLPAGVRAGTPSASTVTIRDTPNAPAGLTATAARLAYPQLQLLHADPFACPIVRETDS